MPLTRELVRRFRSFFGRMNRIVALVLFVLVGWWVGLFAFIVTAVADGVGIVAGGRVSASIRLGIGGVVLVLLVLISGSGGQPTSSVAAVASPTPPTSAAASSIPSATPAPSVTPAPSPSPSPSPSPTPVASPSPQPTVTPIPAPTPNGVVGKALTVGDWVVTVNSVTQVNSTNEFIAPDPGNLFWVLDVTMNNQSGAAAGVGSGWQLQDSQGFIHDAEVINDVKTPELSGTVASGATVRGYLTFQMAKAAKPTLILFKPDWLADQVRIAVK